MGNDGNEYSKHLLKQQKKRIWNSSKTFGQNFKLTHHKWKWNWNWNWKGGEAEQVNNLVSQADWLEENQRSQPLIILFIMAISMSCLKKFERGEKGAGDTVDSSEEEKSVQAAQLTAIKIRIGVVIVNSISLQWLQPVVLLFTYYAVLPLKTVQFIGLLMVLLLCLLYGY